jgi:hypothetical protein
LADLTTFEQFLVEFSHGLADYSGMSFAAKVRMSHVAARDEKLTFTTWEDQQTLADDMIVLLTQIINDTDDPKIRKQTEEEIKRWERHRKKVS